MAVDDWRRRLLGQALSGVLAALAFAFVELRPSLPFLFLTVFLVGLILGGRATAGLAKMYAGALTTFLILFGSGIAPLPTTTPRVVRDPDRLRPLAVGYTLCMMALLWPREICISISTRGLRRALPMCNGPPPGENDTDSVAETVAVRMVVQVD